MRIIDLNPSQPYKFKLSNTEFETEYLKSTGRKVLYIHTPFCPSKCKYCICKSVAVSNRETVDDYAMNILIPQIEKASNVLDNVAFDEVYFGGGTPTYISPDILEKVFNSINCFKEIPKKCIEASPQTLQTEHMDLFQKCGFNFLSLGIQSMQPDVCSWQNRYYVSKDQVKTLSDYIRNTGIYFNYDLISYLGKGDFRDVKGFEEDLYYMMEECRPSSINIHQHHQTTYTTEKMIKLYEIIRKGLSDYPEYICVNSRLLDIDAYEDMAHQAQYRLVRENVDFYHYMWNKFPEMPVYGYDVFALGFTDRISPKSNAGELVFKPGSCTAKRVVFDETLYDDYRNIRKEKGLKE